MTIQTLSPDSQAVLLLASSIALPRDDRAARPLSLREWNELARVVAASDLQRPGALLGRGAQDLRREVGVPQELADRLARLLSRGVQLALEIDRLKGRGIWVLTRAEDAYPQRWKKRLGPRAPVVVFGAGTPRLLTPSRAIAIVGSRDVDESGREWTRVFATRCARDRITVVSGAARGVDRTAMLSSIDASGSAIGLVAESLEQMIRHRELREHVTHDRLTMITPLHPAARFTAGAAMERNKLIYALVDWAVVVASAAGQGGTWTGALENLKAGWAPLFVRNGSDVPDGNRHLLTFGARAIRMEELPPGSGLAQWLDSASKPRADVADIGRPLLVRERPSSYEARRDAFTMLWPALRDYLEQPRTEADVIGAFQLERSQARKWLARAVEEGVAEKLRRPTRYRSVRQTRNDQPGLFET